MNIPKIETPSSTTIFFEGKSYTVSKADPKFQEFCQAIEGEDVNRLRLSLGVSVTLPIYSNGLLKIEHGEIVNCEGAAPIHAAVKERIVALLQAGKKFDYMLNFLARVKANPSETAVEELYLFLEKAQIPITPDGHFLAYRKVDRNYMSYHKNPDGTQNSNRVGEEVTMDRAAVDTNRNSTCSKGLHFCSFSYLSEYNGGSGRVMVVKIDPADVVSIPSDYSNAKGRCCRYKVVAEHIDGEKKEAFKNVVLANPDGTTHEGKDVELKQTRPVVGQGRLVNRVIAYIRNKLDRGETPTVRQVQSSLSPTIPSMEKTVKLVEQAGFKLADNGSKGFGQKEITN